ncbi:hypothetical protein [Streptomyces sp. NPDC059783]|uniref:hypothetical protein n=1 Tax=Streptomyces sp. NPDC059783 TaxID=3346944 RepID=UPI00364E320C
MPVWLAVLITVLCAVVVLSPFAAVVAFVYAYGEVHANMRFPSDDVTLSSCHRDAVTGAPVARIRVESRAARPGSFKVYVRFRDSRGENGGAGRGVPAGRSTVVVGELAVGAVADRDIVGPVPVRGRPECEIHDVVFRSSELAAQGSPFPSAGP